MKRVQQVYRLWRKEVSTSWFSAAAAQKTKETRLILIFLLVLEGKIFKLCYWKAHFNKGSQSLLLISCEVHLPNHLRDLFRVVVNYLTTNLLFKPAQNTSILRCSLSILELSPWPIFSNLFSLYSVNSSYSFLQWISAHSIVYSLVSSSRINLILAILWVIIERSISLSIVLKC